VALGIEFESMPDPGEYDFPVWPENEQPVTFFMRMSTQWRVSMSGVIGFDYNVLFKMFELYGIKDQASLFEDIIVMEYAAIGTMNKAKN
jgi:hypothetical protein